MTPGVGSLQLELATGQPVGGNNPMPIVEADARFLKRILMALVAATIATGCMAGLATVQAERQIVTESQIQQ
jgi:hypothetical protein